MKRIRKGKRQGQQGEAEPEGLLEKQLLQLRRMKMIGKEKRRGQQE